MYCKVLKEYGRGFLGYNISEFSEGIQEDLFVGEV
jgi:hypothetical protein